MVAGQNLGMGVRDASSLETRDKGDSEGFPISTSVDNVGLNVTFVPLNMLLPVNNLADSYRAQGNNVTTTANTNASLTRIIDTIKPADGLTPGGPTTINAAMNAEKQTNQVSAAIDKVKQMTKPDPNKTTPVISANMTPPPPTTSISLGGGPSYFSSRSGKNRDKDRTASMWMPDKTPDPVFNAVNFTATPPTVVARAGNGVKPQTPGGHQLSTFDVNNTGDSLSGIKLANLERRMGQVGQRNFAIGSAARNVLVEAGLRNGTGTPPNVAYRPPVVKPPSGTPTTSIV